MNLKSQDCGWSEKRNMQIWYVEWTGVESLKNRWQGKSSHEFWVNFPPYGANANGISFSKGVLCVYMIFVSSLVLVKTE